MDESKRACCGPGGCGEVSRRELLRIVAAGALGALVSPPVMAGPFDPAEFEKLVPADKKLHPDWVRSLFERGSPTVYRGKELGFIGMPVGGLCAGQLYLGGDGKLWHWDIFNRTPGTGDGHYAHPPRAQSSIAQGFELQFSDGKAWTLDATSFPEVSFSGQYPIATVEYAGAGCPFSVTLEAFSPFVPLDVDASSLPCTILHFSVKNTSGTKAEALLSGWLQNAVCASNPFADGVRRNRILRSPGMTWLDCGAASTPAPVEAARPDIVFENWNKDNYAGWKVEGTAFGTRPAKKSEFPAYQGDVGGPDEHVVNSHVFAPGGDVGAKDSQTGKLTSSAFTIERNFVNFWIGGGGHAGKTCLNLIVDGKAVQSATGNNDNRMSTKGFDVRSLKGKQGVLEIVDAEKGGWGNIGVGRITFSDRPATGGVLSELPDFGSMGLALLGAPAEEADASREKSGNGNREDAAASLSEHLIGQLKRKLSLEPGASAEVTFVIAWRFPNLVMNGIKGGTGRYYAERFASAQSVAQHVAEHFEHLTTLTKLWRDTWYDSTLPYWMLDRTMANTSILATSTCYRFANGRFYGWEGVGCCEGTCTHVWQYEQAMGRLFPELDILLREKVDFNPGIALHADGVIGHRGEHLGPAIDGQAGTILRAYRDHQMSADDAFLKRNWAGIRKAMEWLIQQDGNKDGILEGAQHNTLDAEWFGPVAWLSGMYLAALRASEEMAKEAGDAAFAQQCRAILAVGPANLVKRTFNGEYFMQVADPKHKDSVGSYDGCEIDQVLGQQWAHQVGLGHVLPEEETRQALASIWKYNFTPDVGPYRKAFTPGRWYALAGEAGTLMCTWPKGDASRVSKGYDYYFNECMTGFEHQVAAHMLWAGMVQEGLAIERAIHDRYHASRRNPWNEVECGDHYARAMASYGVFTAVCGFEYHGPKGHLGFAPRSKPENFKCAFTGAEGWGSYAQKIDGAALEASVSVKQGRLRLKTLALHMPEGAGGLVRGAEVGGKDVVAVGALKGRRLLVRFKEEIVVVGGETLRVRCG